MLHPQCVLEHQTLKSILNIYQIHLKCHPKFGILTKATPVELQMENIPNISYVPGNFSALHNFYTSHLWTSSYQDCMVKHQSSLNVTLDSFSFPADNIFHIRVKVNREREQPGLMVRDHQSLERMISLQTKHGQENENNIRSQPLTHSVYQQSLFILSPLVSFGILRAISSLQTNKMAVA